MRVKVFFHGYTISHNNVGGLTETPNAAIIFNDVRKSFVYDKHLIRKIEVYVSSDSDLLGRIETGEGQSLAGDDLLRRDKE